MSDIFYRITDEKGNFADKYSFQEISKDKWSYFSSTRYLSGSILYPTPNDNIIKLLDYLVHMNDILGQSKQFFIVPFDITDLDFDSECIEEELVVGRKVRIWLLKNLDQR